MVCSWPRNPRGVLERRKSGYAIRHPLDSPILPRPIISATELTYLSGHAQMRIAESRSRGLSSFLIAALIALVGNDAGAQSSRPLAGAGCSGCRIQLSNAVRLGDRDGPGAFTRLPCTAHRRIAVDSRGTIVAGVGDGDAHAPWRFDVTSGKYLGRLGRVGRGPGEFHLPGVMYAMLEDSLLVFDVFLRRYSVLQPSDASWVRGGSVPRVFDAVPLPRGGFVASAAVPVRNSVGYPLHLFDWHGDIRRSFGTDIARRDPRDGRAHQHLLTLSGDSAFWAVQRNYEYRLDLYTIAGDRVRTFQREVPWFRAYTWRDFQPLSPTSPPPPPHVQSVREDDQGRLWVAVAVPAARWRTGISQPRRGAEGHGTYVISSPDRVFDTILEVIDPHREEILVSQRLDQFVCSILPTGHIVSIEVVNDQPYLRVMQATLLVPPR
jgi:hypothetical protein